MLPLRMHKIKNLDIFSAKIKKVIYYLKKSCRMQNKIILDTNIWYAIANGEKFEFMFNCNPVVATYINYDELTVSPNLLDDKIELVQSVLIKMSLLKTYDLMENTIDYIIKLDDPTYNNEHYFENYASVSEDVTKLISGEQNKEYYLNHKDVIETRKEQLNQIGNAFIDRLGSTKVYVEGLIRSKVIHKDVFWDEDHSGFAKHVITEWIRIASPTNHELSATFDWKKIELFLAVTEQLLKQLIMTNKKMKANDWYDLFILKYVQPGDKYLTREKFWLEMINKARMDKYLMSQSNP